MELSASPLSQQQEKIVELTMEEETAKQGLPANDFSPKPCFLLFSTLVFCPPTSPWSSLTDTTEEVKEEEESQETTLDDESDRQEVAKTHPVNTFVVASEEEEEEEERQESTLDDKTDSQDLAIKHPVNTSVVAMYESNWLVAQVVEKTSSLVDDAGAAFLHLSYMRKLTGDMLSLEVHKLALVESLKYWRC